MSRMWEGGCSSEIYQKKEKILGMLALSLLQMGELGRSDEERELKVRKVYKVESRGILHMLLFCVKMGKIVD